MSLKLRLILLSYFLAFICCGIAELKAQGSAIPIGNESYRILDRLEIKSGHLPHYHSSLKAYTRGDAMEYAIAVNDLLSNENSFATDSLDFIYLCCDNNEWLVQNKIPQTAFGRKEGYFEKTEVDSLFRFVPFDKIKTNQESQYFFTANKPIWNYFYQTPANWFEINKNDFYIKVNPILNFKVAKSGDSKEELLFINQRGVELRGGIDNRLYFYSNITDTQSRFPGYVNEFIDKNKAVPGNGFYKPYDSSIFNSEGSFDYLNGQGYIGLNITESIGMQFGHGKNFIGNGYRSLLLSDFSHNYFYLKFNWRFWKFHYQNIFTELSANSAQSNPGEKNLPKKYMAAHYLGINLLPTVSFGLFEAVIFDRDNGQFELQYLNPVILYRSVEHLLDSEDNIIVGLDFKWNFLRKGRLYSQLVLDEFKFGELTGGNGWWANKFGIQIGTQLIDLFKIPQLDARIEYNTVRPYTYTYRESQSASYSHYNQALAHPLGANFRELLATFRYQPFKRISLNGRIILAEFGEDGEDENWGGNILLSNVTHEMDFGNETGQGVGATTTLFGVDLSYQIWHNIHFDVQYFYRNKVSDLDSFSRTDSFIGGGFRINVADPQLDF